MRIAWNVIRETGCKRPTFCIVSRRIDSSTLECTSRRMIPCFPYYRILSLVWAIVPLLPPFNVNVLLGRLPRTWVIIVKYVVAFESRVVEFRYCARLVILFFFIYRGSILRDSKLSKDSCVSSNFSNSEILNIN